MKRDFIHNVYSSFVLWFDHELLTEGEAFTNTTGQLYRMKDQNISGANIFGSTSKQWVYDSSVPGANVPNGVTANNSTVSRGTNGLRLDFQNGRAIFTSNVPSSYNVSASYAAKDFNIYSTTKSDYELLFETRYMVNPTTKQVATGVLADKLIAPCIFLKVKGFENQPLAFGGQESTSVYMRAVILADNEFNLNAVGNIFVDTNRTNLLILPDTPLNRYNDTRNGYYNYTGSVNSSFSYDRLAYISNVSFNKLTNQSVGETMPDLHIGFLDFTLEVHRWPHA